MNLDKLFNDLFGLGGLLVARLNFGHLRSTQSIDESRDLPARSLDMNSIFNHLSFEDSFCGLKICNDNCEGEWTTTWNICLSYGAFENMI